MPQNSVVLCVFTPCNSVVKNKKLNHRVSQSYSQSFTVKNYRNSYFLDTLMNKNEGNIQPSTLVLRFLRQS